MKNMPYNVLRHRDWDQAPRDPFTIGASIAGALGVTSAAGVFLITAATYVGISLVTSWALSALAPKPGLSDTSSRGLLVNQKDAISPHDFVYGEVRKGGTVTYYETTGENNKFLHQIIVLAGHEVDAIGDIYLNDEVVTVETVTTYNYEATYFLSFDGSDPVGYIASSTSTVDLPVGSVTRSQLVSIGISPDPSGIYLSGDITSKTVQSVEEGLVTSEPWNSKIRIKKHLGTAAQTVDADLLAESQQITSDFRGRGLAYIYVRHEFDRDVFANGLPLITAVVRGKKLFDPRTSTTAWSKNAALCTRDYISATYGLNDDQIDDTAFSAAANICDENVTLAVGGTEKRYTINGVARADQQHGDVLQSMMTACAGSLFWGAGKWKLVVGDYVAPTKVLTLDDLRGPINLSTRVSLQDQFNGVQGTFNNAAERWITTDYKPVTSSVFEAEDGGERTLLDLALPFTTSAATARRLAKLTLFRGREQMTLTADFGLNAFDVEVGEIIAFTNPRYGWDEKEFEVVGWTFGSAEAGDLRVTLTLRETSEAAFDWNAEEGTLIQNNTTLPSAFTGLDVNNLTVSGGGRTQGDGTFINSALLSWDAASSAFTSYYEVEWKPVADINYASTTTTETDIELNPIVDGIQYFFRVRAVSILGTKGPFTSVTFTVGGDTVAPSLPTSITATGHFEYISISWTRPANTDLNYIEIYENSSNSTVGATLVGISSGDTFQRTNLGPNVTKFYFLKSVDYSGNASGFTTGVSATTTFLDDADFANGIYSLFTDQGLYAIQDVNSLPVSGDFVGQKVFNRTDNKLYQWTGSAWELVVAEPDTFIASDKIIANTITGGLLATSGIITNTAQINDLIVDSAKIKNLAVERIKIGDNAVSEVNNAEIGSFNYTATQFNANTTILSLPSPTLGNITTECYFSFVFDAITNPAPHSGYLPLNGWLEVRLQISANFITAFPTTFFDIGPVFSGQATKPNISTVNKVLLSGSVFLTPTQTKADTVFRARVSTAVYDSSGTLLGTSGEVDGLMFTRLLAK